MRVTLHARRDRTSEDFAFAFARDRHTSIAQLLDGVAEAYTGRRDVQALGGQRLMMKLARKNGEALGGRVVRDGDVWDLSRVVGGGWIGMMEIG